MSTTGGLYDDLGVSSAVPRFLSHKHLPLRSLRELASRPHINPSVLVIVIILSVVFFCSGVLHILARCLGRRRAREPAGGLSSPSVSVRGQLQHLFSLHDSGVEQVFIDTLPVFLYGSIRGLKDSADCAVCLNEFANEDKLRLLPKCKHAFHMECIDTWLLSNSTCPLCRRSLLPEAEPVIPGSGPVGCAGAIPHSGEQGGISQPQLSHGSFRRSFGASLRGSFRFLADAVAPGAAAAAAAAAAASERDAAPVALQNPNVVPPSTEMDTPPMTPGPTVCVTEADGSEKMLRVELGKVNSFGSRRAVGRDVGTCSRMPRSYSMGHYEYVVDLSSLGVAAPFSDQQSEESPPWKATHRSTLSDSIPELASASRTPGQEDMFWARRGLDTPHSLSRVREIMTPSPGWLSSPSQPLQQVVHIDHDEEEQDGEIEVLCRENSWEEGGKNASAGLEETEMVGMCDEKQAVEGQGEAPHGRSLSPSLLKPVEARFEGCNPLQQHPGSGNAGTLQESVAAARMDKLWEVSVDVPAPRTSVEGSDSSSPSWKKSSPLNWLRGRSRRSMVYSAASPSSTDMQSAEEKVT